jgi:hypothetical protein
MRRERGVKVRSPALVPFSELELSFEGDYEL